MTQVSRKGFVDKNGNQVSIVPNVPGATAGNLPKFDENGNLQDSGIDAGLVGNAKFLYKLEIQKSGDNYVWGASTTQAMLEEVYNTLANGPSDAIPVRVQLPGFTYAGYATKGQSVGGKELRIFVGTVAFQVQYNTNSNQWTPPVIISFATVLDALKSTEQLSSGNDYRLITSGAVKAALDGKSEISRGNNGWVVVTANGQVQVVGEQSVLIGISDMETAAITLNNIANLKCALEAPAAYAETLNQRKQYILGIYLVKGTTLADYTIENINDSAIQSYISEIAETGTGRIDHLVIGVKDGATTYELLSTVHIENTFRIVLYIGDIGVIIHRNNIQSAWELGEVVKISSLF